MRNFLIILSLAALAALIARPGSKLDQELTLDLQGVPQEQALREVAETLGLEPIFTDSFWHIVDLRCQNVPASEVLDELVGRNEWKLAGDRVLFIPIRYPAIACGNFRMEYLCEKAPNDEVLKRLSRLYPEGKFTPHPTMNGFYVSGTRAEMLEIKRLKQCLDSVPVPPLPSVVTFPAGLRVLGSERVLRDVATAFPGLEIRVQERRLEFTGPIEKVIAARKLVENLEAAAAQAIRERKERFECDFADGAGGKVTVSCRSDCLGPLHDFGLLPGDILNAKSLKDSRARPEWLVKRKGDWIRVPLP